MKNVKRGAIYYADLSPVIGSEQDGTRPVLILQKDVKKRTRQIFQQICPHRTAGLREMRHSLPQSRMEKKRQEDNGMVLYQLDGIWQGILS